MLRTCRVAQRGISLIPGRDAHLVHTARSKKPVEPENVCVGASFACLEKHLKDWNERREAYSQLQSRLTKK